MTWLLFFLLALGTARVVQLITEDHLPIIAKPREWVVAKNPEGNLAYLVNCWWCVSVYVGAGAAAFAVWVLQVHWASWDIGWNSTCESACFQQVPDWKVFLLLWPALSMASTMIQGAADWLTTKGE